MFVSEKKLVFCEESVFYSFECIKKEFLLVKCVVVNYKVIFFFYLS